MKQWKYFFFVFFLLLIAWGCGSSWEDAVDKRFQEVAGRIRFLESALVDGRIPKAVLLQSYIDVVRKKKPALRDLLDSLAEQTGRENFNLKNLKRRHSELARFWDSDKSKANAAVVDEQLQELQGATDPATFDNTFIDEINTVAGMSDGELPVVDLPSGTNVTPGENLVGNPAYGEWKRDSSGDSFWSWYGKWALFSHLMGGGRHSYANWYYHRPWSYDYDVYRSRHGGARWKQQEMRRLESNWGSISKNRNVKSRRQSSYATRSNPRHKSGQDAFSKSRESVVKMGTNANRRSSSYGTGSRTERSRTMGEDTGSTRRSSSLQSAGTRDSGKASVSRTTSRTRRSSSFGGSTRTGSRSRSMRGGK